MKPPRLKLNFRTVFWAAAVAILTIVLILAFRPRAAAVEMAPVTRGPMTVAVRDEGRTRARDLYVVSAPVAGRLLRVGNRAGQPVEAGSVVAVLRPVPPTLVDERTRREIEATVRAAQAGLTLSRAELDRAEAQLAHARLEASRTETLFAADVASRAAVDRARLGLRTAEAAVENARAGVGVRQADLQAARVRLIEPPEPAPAGRTVEIRAPAAGRVLRVLQESENVVAQGAPIMEIGDPRGLEVVAEFLSSDAARIRAGASALIDAWGGEQALRGRVRQVEPYGFLKVSALGIEEQRVNVIIDLVDPPAAWAAVGHGYRVEAAVTVWSAPEVVQAPVAALFRRDGRWAVFRVENGRARLREVGVGRNNGEMAEIRTGLRVGDQLVLHPGPSISAGRRVRAREAD